MWTFFRVSLRLWWQRCGQLMHPAAVEIMRHQLCMATVIQWEVFSIPVGKIKKGQLERNISALHPTPMFPTLSHLTPQHLVIRLNHQVRGALALGAWDIHMVKLWCRCRCRNIALQHI
jgi:hypothetical protein